MSFFIERFLILPDMLKNAPMLKKTPATRGLGRGRGGLIRGGRGRGYRGAIKAGNVRGKY